MAHRRTLLMLALVAFAAAILLVALLTATVVAGDDALPRTIRVTAPLENVVCKLGCCCGYASVIYRGHYYDTGIAGYCRWFRPLHDGQRVTLTLRLAR